MTAELAYFGLYTVIVLMLGAMLGASLTYKRQTHQRPFSMDPAKWFEAITKRKPDEEERELIGDGEPIPDDERYSP